MCLGSGLSVREPHPKPFDESNQKYTQNLRIGPNLYRKDLTQRTPTRVLNVVPLVYSDTGLSEDPDRFSLRLTFRVWEIKCGKIK